MSDYSYVLMRQALDEARKCEPVLTAFSVGCVLAVTWPTDDEQPTVLSTGYSRELPGNTHAEANALAKLNVQHIQSLLPGSNVQEILARVDVYTTLEPCSVRSSGLAPCADALIAAAVRRCFIGVGEPDDFVKCEGAQKLKDAGIQVIWMEGLEKECLEVARKGH